MSKKYKGKELWKGTRYIIISTSTRVNVEVFFTTTNKKELNEALNELKRGVWKRFKGQRVAVFELGKKMEEFDVE
jgi:hypothetical protein